MKLLDAILNIGKESKIKIAHLYPVAKFANGNIDRDVTFNNPNVRAVFLDISEYAINNIPVTVLSLILQDNTFWTNIKSKEVTKADCDEFIKKYPELSDMIINAGKNHLPSTEVHDNYAEIYGNYLNNNKTTKLEQLQKLVVK